MRISPKHARLRTLLIGPLLLIPAACASPTPIPAPSAVTAAGANVGCVEFTRGTFDRLNDTLPTIAWVKSYNAGRDAICGQGK